MKRTIILAITFVCLFVQATFSQQPYRSLKECRNDTAKYLKYNFRERGGIYLYKGKTFEQLMSDLKIKPIGLYLVGGIFEDGSNRIGAIQLFFTRNNAKYFSELKDEYLQIFWETPIIYSNYATYEKAKLSPPVKGQKKYESGYELFTAYPQGDWVPQYYDFFKDKIISVIGYNVMRY